jgi:hypothetical protein
MFNQGILSSNQRGFLKELILDNNQKLNDYLFQFELDGLIDKFYENVLGLAS